MVDALWKPNLVAKKKGRIGLGRVIKGYKERGLDNGALSGGVGSRLPPKHEVSTPVNEKTSEKAEVERRRERAESDIALTLVRLGQSHRSLQFITQGIAQYNI